MKTDEDSRNDDKNRAKSVERFAKKKTVSKGTAREKPIGSRLGRKVSALGVLQISPNVPNQKQRSFGYVTIALSAQLMPIAIPPAGIVSSSSCSIPSSFPSMSRSAA